MRGTVAILRQYVPDCQITLASYDAQNDATRAKHIDIDVDAIVPGLLTGPRRGSVGWLWQTLDRRLLQHGQPHQEYRYLPFYRGYDIVISVGGDNFGDDYGEPGRYFEAIELAKKAGAKTVIWGASIGPFHDDNAAARWARILKQVDLITAREDLTVAYLESLGVADNVRPVADPAFLMPACEPDSVIGIPDRPGKMVVGIGMSDLVTRYGYGISGDEYMRAFTGFIRYLREALDATVVLVPHVIGTAVGTNDMTACQEVIRHLPISSDLAILDESYDARQMKYCISQCDFFVGARTHSTIAALSTGVPTISIAYSAKAWGINKAVLDTDEFVMPIKEVSYNRLTRCFAKLRDRASEIRAQLRERIPSVLAQAQKAGEHLAEVITAEGGRQTNG